jgi:hypothetical protein
VACRAPRWRPRSRAGATGPSKRMSDPSPSGPTPTAIPCA